MTNSELTISELIRIVFIHLLSFLYRHKLWLFISISIGLLLAILFIFCTNDIYTSTLIAKPNIYEPVIIAEQSVELHISQQLTINKYDLVLVVNSLNVLLNDKKMFSKVVNIPLVEANRIKQFETDTISLTDYFFVKLTYQNGLNLDTVENGLINYINSNKLISEKTRIAKTKTKKLILGIENEIKKIEVLQEKIIQAKNNNSNEVVNIDNYNKFYHNDVLSLSLLKQDLISSNESSNAIDLSQSFSFVKEKRYPRYIVILVSLFTAFFIGLFRCLIFDLIKKTN